MKETEKNLNALLSEEKSKVFYDDLKKFHDKTTDITSLMRDFKREVGNDIKLNYKYGSVRIRENKMEETDISMPKGFKQPIEKWSEERIHNAVRIKDKILKMELGEDKIFLFKIFDDFGEDKNYVMAGYLLNASPEFRLFLAKTAEEELLRSASLLLSAL